jgi:predicted Rossmann fold flavoprotein
MKTVIIGGGAAGLMTAASLYESNPDAEIVLLEKNDALGKKVMISGGGRCNVTTGIKDIKTVLTKYPRGGKFLSSAMHAFPPESVYAWFEDHGVPLKTEADMRVFPKTDSGKDIIHALESLLRGKHITITLKADVTKVEKAGDHFQTFLKGTNTPIESDTLVLTTGGQAFRQTGSTGDGYAFAQSLGHSITKLAPSLSALTASETWPALMAGRSYPYAKLTALTTKPLSFTGAFLFTHKGISGPAVFALSSLIAFETVDAQHPLEINIDLFPDQKPEEVRGLIDAAIIANPKKNLANILGTVVTKSFVDIMQRELLLEDRRANETPKKEIMRVAAWLKRIPLHIVGRGAGDEFVTAGGVDLKEVNPSTMESKKCPNLYLAGEILDIDAFTGGFNLQSAWATGHLAGESIAKIQ